MLAELPTLLCKSGYVFGIYVNDTYNTQSELHSNYRQERGENKTLRSQLTD